MKRTKGDRAVEQGMRIEAKKFRYTHPILAARGTVALTIDSSEQSADCSWLTEGWISIAGIGKL